MKHSVAEKIDYTGKLMRAGLNGLVHANGTHPAREMVPILEESTRHSLMAAAIGAGIGFISCSLLPRRSRTIPTVLACGAVAFCADFTWMNRRIGSEMAKGAVHEMEKVRDAHWLELNPIDYA